VSLPTIAAEGLINTIIPRQLRMGMGGARQALRGATQRGIEAATFAQASLWSRKLFQEFEIPTTDEQILTMITGVGLGVLAGGVEGGVTRYRPPPSLANADPKLVQQILDAVEVGRRIPIRIDPLTTAPTAGPVGRRGIPVEPDVKGARQLDTTIAKAMHEAAVTMERHQAEMSVKVQQGLSAMDALAETIDGRVSPKVSAVQRGVIEGQRLLPEAPATRARLVVQGREPDVLGTRQRDLTGFARGVETGEVFPPGTRLVSRGPRVTELPARLPEPPPPPAPELPPLDFLKPPRPELAPVQGWLRLGQPPRGKRGLRAVAQGRRKREVPAFGGARQGVLPFEEGGGGLARLVRARRQRDLDYSLLPAEARGDPHFQTQLAAARQEGYTGSTSELWRRYVEQIEGGMDRLQAEEAVGPTGILQKIVAAGGLKRIDKTFGEGMGTLVEMIDLRSVKVRGTERLKDVPVTTGAVAGVKGVFAKTGGKSIGEMLRTLQQDPDLRPLVEAMDDNEFFDLVETTMRRAKTGLPSEDVRELSDFGPQWWTRPDDQSDIRQIAEGLDGMLDSPTFPTWEAQQIPLRILDGWEKGQPFDARVWRDSLAGSQFLRPISGGASKRRAPVRPGPPEQPSLPGAEDVRAQEIPTPEFEAPFALTPQVAERMASQRSFLDRLKSEEGVLILDVRPGDPTGLRKFLRRTQTEHGDAAWWNKVEQLLDDGDDLLAWRTAAVASIKDLARTGRKLTTEERAQRDELRRLTDEEMGFMRGQTPPGPARQREAVRKGAPGVPPIRRPLEVGLSRTFSKDIIEMALENSDPKLVTIIKNDPDAPRLFAQIAEQAAMGVNTRQLKRLGLSDGEIGAHFLRTVSNAGRILQRAKHFQDLHADEITFLEKALGAGAVVKRKGDVLGLGQIERVRLGKGLYMVPGVTPSDRTIDILASALGSQARTQAIWDLTRVAPGTVSRTRALSDFTRAALLSQLTTAIRNTWSQTARYEIGILDQVFSGAVDYAYQGYRGVMGHGMQTDRARQHFIYASELFKAGFRGPKGTRAPGANANVWDRLLGRDAPAYRPWTSTTQDIFDYTAESLRYMSPKDLRKTLGFLQTAPSHDANFAGWMAGMHLVEGQVDPRKIGAGLINKITSPKVRNWLTVLNRSQEFQTRATVYDATFRSQLRQRGLNPAEVLSGEDFMERLAQQIGPEELDQIIGTATYTALDYTFASKPLRDSFVGQLVGFASEGKMGMAIQIGYPFPRFNLVSAPRFIYDHSPLAMMDWLTDPFGIGNSRFSRGRRAARSRQAIPEILGKKQSHEVTLGKSLVELTKQKQAFRVHERLMNKAAKKWHTGGDQANFPELESVMSQQSALMDSARARVDELNGIITDSRQAVRLLNAEEDIYRRNIAISGQLGAAESFPEFFGRQINGTLQLFGLALIMRSSPGAEGTNYYQYEMQKNDGMGTRTLIDQRSMAPIVQYFMPQEQWLEEWTEQPLSPDTYLEIFSTIWDNYEGKYQGSDQVMSTFAEAFFSMSRASGATLTLTDLVMQQGWPGPADVGRAVVASMGQLLARLTVPGRPLKDLASIWDPEQATVYQPSKVVKGAGIKQALAQPLANLPFGKDIADFVGLPLEPIFSQTTGERLVSQDPARRQFTGLSFQIQDDLTSEFKKIGLPFSTWGVRKTGDTQVDRQVALELSRIYNEELLPFLQDDADYYALKTPAAKRVFLQRSNAFAQAKDAAKRAAAQVVGVERVFRAFQTPGEERNLRILLEGLERIEAAQGPPARP
jgi:hypothetical protein